MGNASCTVANKTDKTLGIITFSGVDIIYFNYFNYYECPPQSTLTVRGGHAVHVKVAVIYDLKKDGRAWYSRWRVRRGKTLTLSDSPRSPGGFDGEGGDEYDINYMKLRECDLVREKRLMGGSTTETMDFDWEEELDKIVGMEITKQEVKSLAKRMEGDSKRTALGLQNPPVLPHRVFEGNPGTGKTTIARILAKILYQLGVVKKDLFVSVQANDLVEGYVSQTSKKTRGVINKAKGGVLFVDEVYRLNEERTFGQEAIDELMVDMDGSQDPVIFVAGYSEKMEQFLKSNAGLARRFNNHRFHCPDYSTEEIAEIFIRNATGYNNTFENGVDVTFIAQLLDQHTTTDWRSVRNGAISRILLDLCHVARYNRIPDDFTVEQAQNLTADDVTKGAERLMAVDGSVE